MDFLRVTAFAAQSGLLMNEIEDRAKERPESDVKSRRRSFGSGPLPRQNDSESAVRST